MKKYLFLFLFLFSIYSSAQVLCVQCYNQNERVLNLPNDLILNGGFENTTCIDNDIFCPNSSSYNCDISNWTCTGGGLQTYASISTPGWPISIIVEGTNAAYFGNWFCSACSSSFNDTSCITTVGCEATGILDGYPNNISPYGGTNGVSLEQTLNGLLTGNIYVLEFWAGGESDSTWFLKEGIFAVDVGFGNIFLRDPPTPANSSIGKRHVIAFAATSSSHTIKFTNWGHACDSCTELVLDDVRLFQTSEGSDPCSNGINELTTNSVTVFPNPVTNLLTVTTNTNEPSVIILYDATSRKLLQQKFITSISLNTSQLAGGLYFYEVRNENGAVKQGRVIKL